jgi:hypothetical protein
MKTTTAITCVGLDIGGVLLTDGWSHRSRKLAATVLDLNPTEMETGGITKTGEYPL